MVISLYIFGFIELKTFSWRSCLCCINRAFFYEVSPMFYEVRVFDSRGQLKKVVSSKKLSNRFWNMHDNLPSYYDEGSGKPEDWSSRNKMKAKKISLDESL